MHAARTYVISRKELILFSIWQLNNILIFNGQKQQGIWQWHNVIQYNYMLVVAVGHDGDLYGPP